MNNDSGVKAKILGVPVTIYAEGWCVSLDGWKGLAATLWLWVALRVAVLAWRSVRFEVRYGP